MIDGANINTILNLQIFFEVSFSHQCRNSRKLRYVLLFGPLKMHNIRS